MEDSITLVLEVLSGSSSFRVNVTVLGLKCRSFVMSLRCAVFLKPLLFASGGLALTELNMSAG